MPPLSSNMSSRHRSQRRHDNDSVWTSSCGSPDWQSENMKAYLVTSVLRVTMKQLLCKNRDVMIVSVWFSPGVRPQCCAGSWRSACTLLWSLTCFWQRCLWTCGWTRSRTGCGLSSLPSASLPLPSHCPAAGRRSHTLSCCPDCRSASRRGPALPPSLHR